MGGTQKQGRRLFTPERVASGRGRRCTFLHEAEAERASTSPSEFG
jgi:hypothetical protein